MVMMTLAIFTPQCSLMWRRFEVVYHAVDEVEPGHDGDVHGDCSDGGND